MRKLPVDILRPGMKIARTIYNGNGNVLLKKGAILNQSYLKRLKKLDIPAVYIDDGLLAEAEVEDVIADETRLKAVKNIKNVFSKGIKSKNIIAPAEVLDSVTQIIDELLSNNNLVVNLTDIRTKDNYVFAHSVNVAVLALVTGIALGYNRSKLTSLAVGAMLHDIGKIKVPDEILNKPGKLTEEEFKIIKKHTIWGYEILKANFDVDITACVAAYQHHERYNGEGYPQGLEGEQIHEFAQIIGLVDMYDAITADRVYRKAFPSHEAFEMIAASGNYLFRYDLVKTFLDHVAAYAYGTIVQLNTGEIAVVMETKPGMSLRPKVKVIFDSERRPILNNLYLDLSTVNNVTITKVIDESELQLPDVNISCLN